MIKNFDFELLEQFEQSSEYKLVLNQLRELEANLKERVNEEVWDLIMKWEELWAHLLFEQHRLFICKSDNNLPTL